ncbi:MAG: hypothetical protein HY042_05325 [Spirochaetia bacterium]|nr:hypothetical protein [Spirochaetia bacterium]
MEEYGRSSYAVREVPTYLEPGEEKTAVVRVIQRILEGESVVRIYDEYAAMKACKASIKKNDVVSSGVLAGILGELAQCAEPARCPHGRPTMVRITPADLDRLFGRT